MKDQQKTVNHKQGKLFVSHLKEKQQGVFVRRTNLASTSFGAVFAD